MKRYNPKEIEPKWQQTWADSKIYEASEDPAKPKRYILEYFPYPSGAAMHVGHVRNYTIGDVMSRHARMNGYNVLHPMGWDAFGLPAENYAIKTGVSPQQAIAENTGKFKEQLNMMGFSYDWSREFWSSDPDYYRWTQWFFLLLYKRGLAYRQESLQWWCPIDKTVLANEQVENGHCWRCGSEVEKKALKQWFFKITDYADRLEKDLDDINWSDGIKTMQRNWIGRSTGAEVDFVVGDNTPEVKDTLKFTPSLTKKIQDGKKWSTIRLEPKNVTVGDYVKLQTRVDKNEVHSFAIAKIKSIETKKLSEISNNHPGHDSYNSDAEKLSDYRAYYGQEVTLDTVFTIYEFEKTNEVLSIFTTRVDTLYGATYMVVAPEHPILGIIVPESHMQQVLNYQQKARNKSDIERQETNREKTGVFTGAYAVNPLSGEKLPIWTADYVLAGYGTGAIMAVPAHDERDYAFAKAFDLPIREVVEPQFGSAKGDEKYKQAIIAVVRNPKTGKVLVLDWGPRRENWGGNLFIGGGIEEGEDPIETAKREIAEETGYANIKHIKTSDTYVNNYFYSNVKDQNYHARFLPILFELVDEAQVERNLDDNEDQFKVRWVSEAEVPATITDEAHLHGYRLLTEEICYHGEGKMINSGPYDGMSSSEAREKVVSDLETKGVGAEKVNYRMRDWLISRQRYWGAPIPMIHCPKDGIVPVPEDQLPVKLPELKKFEPSGDGRSPLANVSEFVNVTCPTCGGSAERETDTMDGFACSSWYFLRFADPHNDTKAFDPDKVKFWLPVDDYIGGAEHAVMHLLYARMWTKVMQDENLIDFGEPFKALRNQGMILAPDGQKMSKSKGNTIQPDELIEQGYGADSIRIMELFIGPWNQSANWSVEGMGGSFRFLQRIWNLVQEFSDPNAKVGEQSPVEGEVHKTAHRAIKRVSENLADMGFNTAIAALMEEVNELYRLKTQDNFANRDAWRFALESLLQLLAPFAPHMTEELWQQLGHAESIHMSQWPQYDPKYLVEDTVTIAVQVNGKLRGTVNAPSDASEAQVTELASTSSKIATYLEGKQIIKAIYVPGKLVNFVVK